MLKQFGVSTNYIYREGFLKVPVFKPLYERSNVQLLSSSPLFTAAFCQQKVSKNEMLKQFGGGRNENYQEDFLQVAVLNRSAEGAKISSFRRASCSQAPSVSRKPAKMKCLSNLE